MPTPIPTIAAGGGAQSGTSTTRRSSSASATDMPSPKTAVRSGRPIATAEPKVSSRIRAAAMRPMPPPPAGAACGQFAPRPPGGGLRRQLRDRPAGLHLERVVAGGEYRFQERLRLRRGVLVRGLVE